MVSAQPRIYFRIVDKSAGEDFYTLMEKTVDERDRGHETYHFLERQGLRKSYKVTEYFIKVSRWRMGTEWFTKEIIKDKVTCTYDNGDFGYVTKGHLPPIEEDWPHFVVEFFDTPPPHTVTIVVGEDAGAVDSILRGFTKLSL